jgi:hypothetical protein
LNNALIAGLFRLNKDTVVFLDDELLTLPTLVDILIFIVNAMGMLHALLYCLVMLRPIVGFIAGTDDGVVLGNDGSALCEYSKLTACKFV